MRLVGLPRHADAAIPEGVEVRRAWRRRILPPEAGSCDEKRKGLTALLLPASNRPIWRLRFRDRKGKLAFRLARDGRSATACHTGQHAHAGIRRATADPDKARINRDSAVRASTQTQIETAFANIPSEAELETVRLDRPR